MSGRAAKRYEACMPKKNFLHGNRRHFIKSTSIAVSAAAFGAPFVFTGCKTSDAAPQRKIIGANDRIRIGVIGAGGKGSSDTDTAANAGAEIVGLCDVDKKTLTSRQQKYPQAKTYQDFRKMLDEIGKDMDAVIVSTPDHTHAVACAMAMKMDKHVYCQKPLVHSVYEARVLRQLAKERGLATQMGNQGTAADGLRRAVEVIQAGVVGHPKELHVWSNRPIWPQGVGRPEGEDPVPDNLDWDLWIGPAPMRPYKKDAYHAFAWRGRRDFGTGALGDMACHTVNMPFRALKLGYPTVIECEETSELKSDTYPKTSRIRFEFPAREGLPPLKFWWYDGSPNDKSVKLLRPHDDLTGEIREMRNGALPASGALIIGDKGKVFSPDDYGSQFFLMTGSEKKFTKGNEHEAALAVPKTILRNEGTAGDDQRQKEEWFRMMRGGPPAYSNFDIAAYLTEIILLGCVAMNVGVGSKLDWDGPNMRARNTRAADKFVRREYRKGWTL